MLVQVIDAIDGFTIMGIVRTFFLFDGTFTVMLLERSFVAEKSETLLALVLGSFYWTLYRLLDLSHLLVNRRKHGFELRIG